jgi:formiminotetrahydrofolate cyclodeaminase
MDMTQKSCREFMEKLASGDPTPGGGGAAALVGAAGVALGQMVTNLTVGRKKYAEVEEEMIAIREKLDALRLQLLDLVEADEKAFAPLAAAYAIPKEQPARGEILEKATLEACKPPLAMMETLASALALVAVVAEKGSRLAVSDAGCAAAMIRGAMESASLNVFINTKSLADREAAAALNEKTNRLLETCCPQADAIFQTVRKSFG